MRHVELADSRGFGSDAGRLSSGVCTARSASEWEGSVFDDALHDQGGAEALHAGEGGQVVVVELLEGGQIGGDNAQQVVGVT